jgi:hypothetical protein
VLNRYPDNALDRTFRFLAFGGIGTLTGLACVEMGYSLLYTRPFLFVALPLAAYAVLIAATVYFTRDERISQGVMALGGLGLLSLLVPYIIFMDSGATNLLIFYAGAFTATLFGCLFKWMRRGLRGEMQAFGRGIGLLFLAFAGFILFGMMVLPSLSHGH